MLMQGLGRLSSIGKGTKDPYNNYMTKFIAIEGRGGSGKTYLSEILKSELNARVFHLDDYGSDYEPFIGIPKLVKVLDLAMDDLVIFEGVGVFKSDFDKYNAFNIFVDSPDSVRAKRAGNRDVPRDDRSENDWKEIWKIWSVAEAKYYNEKLKQKANLIVGSKDGEFDIKAIKNEIIK